MISIQQIPAELNAGSPRWAVLCINSTCPSLSPNQTRLAVARNRDNLSSLREKRQERRDVRVDTHCHNLGGVVNADAAF
jgi:hypothetical protein